MTERDAVNRYLAKAIECIEGAESELANRRFNNCANRCYYGCFQAAIAALTAAGIQARSSKGHWRHQTVHAQFVEQLINRRRRYPANLRSVLAEIMLLRQDADYETDDIHQKQASRALRRSQAFVDAVRAMEGTPS